MISNPLTPGMQRRFLLLARYIQALEAGELEIVHKILQTAETDEVLEHMLMEANTLYQVSPPGTYDPAELAKADKMLVTAWLAQLEAGRIRQNWQPNDENSRTPVPISRPGRRRARRLISILAAALLGILLIGGFLTFMNISQSTGPAAPKTGTPPQKRLTISEGWRLEQIASHTATLGLSNFHVQEFLNYTHHPHLFPDAAKYPILQYALTMEGLLYPTTYHISADMNTVQIIDVMLNAFTQAIQQDNLAATARQHKLTEYQLVILASIVQRDANSADAMPLVAGIYWNRIEKPSPEIGPYLQSDPTVEYARDTDHPPVQGHYWVHLSDTGLGNTTSPTSPWNTYTHTGWPPTPISSPGLAALQAAASPTPTNCYYFLFKPADGSIACAQTVAQMQHLEQQ